VDPDALPLDGVALTCRVLFVDDRPGSVVLDCIAADPAGHDGWVTAAGTPLSVEAAIGRGAWASAVRAVIQAWAAADRLVALTFRDGTEGIQVWASDGHTGMLLDLKAPAGT
jgi:hypothetical protein